MEGLYLYCIRDKIENDTADPIKGIDGKVNVYPLVCRGLEAVVSDVSLEEYNSEELARRAKDDINWIKEKATAHEYIIEEMLRKNEKMLRLIPMRFGIIFKKKAGLEETLSKDYLKFNKILDRISGKQEWSLKIYLKDRSIIERTIKENNAVIKEKRKEMDSLSEGMAYFMEEEMNNIISEECDNELDSIIKYIYKSLEKHSADSVNNKILQRALTGKREEMVFNAAYLIPDVNIEIFKKDTEAMNRKMQHKGIYLEYSGPWPCYNFVGD